MCYRNKGIFKEGYSGRYNAWDTEKRQTKDIMGLDWNVDAGCCQVYKTVTDGDELFTMQPNFGAKMVKDKTRQVALRHRAAPRRTVSGVKEPYIHTYIHTYIQYL